MVINGEKNDRPGKMSDLSGVVFVFVNSHCGFEFLNNLQNGIDLLRGTIAEEVLKFSLINRIYLWGVGPENHIG